MNWLVHSMGLTTERKVFLGLVGVAGLALLIDQGFLGPKEASASPELLAQPASTIGSVASLPELPTGQPAAKILIDRLKSMGSDENGEGFGSSFTLSSLIKQPDAPQQGTANASDVTSDLAQSNQAPSTPQADDLPALSAVMPSSTGGGAVLGGKLVRVGEMAPNGYKLLLVHARAVLVEKDGVEYAIEIPAFQHGE